MAPPLEVKQYAPLEACHTWKFPKNQSQFTDNDTELKANDVHHCTTVDQLQLPHAMYRHQGQFHSG